MKNRFKIFMIAALMVFAVADFVQAQALVMGAPRPGTGFPRLVRDPGSGISLGFCLDPRLAFCEPDPVVNGNPQSEATGFGAFANYFQAFFRAAPLGLPTNVDIRLTFEVLGTYTGAIVFANRIVVNRIFVDFAGLPVGGSYLIRHPWGQNRVVVPVNGRLRRFVQRIGRPTDNPPFSVAATGPVKSFLRRITPLPGFIGRFDVDQAVIGSTLVPPRNFVEITGPVGANIGGPAGQENVLRVNRFALQGQFF